MNYPSYIGSFRILFVYGKSYSVIYSTVDKPKIAPTLASSLSPHDNIFFNLQRCSIIFWLPWENNSFWFPIQIIHWLWHLIWNIIKIWVVVIMKIDAFAPDICYAVRSEVRILPRSQTLSIQKVNTAKPTLNNPICLENWKNFILFFLLFVEK